MNANEFTQVVFKDWASKTDQSRKYAISFMNEKESVNLNQILEALEKDTNGWKQLKTCFIFRYQMSIKNLKGSINDETKHGLMFQIIDQIMKKNFIWLYG